MDLSGPLRGDRRNHFFSTGGHEAFWPTHWRLAARLPILFFLCEAFTWSLSYSLALFLCPIGFDTGAGNQRLAGRRFSANARI